MTFLQLWIAFVFLPNLAMLCIHVIIIASILAAVGGMVFGISHGVDTDQPTIPILYKHSKKLLWLLIPGIIFIAIPDKKEMAFILAAQYVTNNEQMAQLPPKILSAFNNYLDEILQDKERV